MLEDTLKTYLIYLLPVMIIGLPSPRSRRDHLSSVQPYRAGPKAGEITPEDTLELICLAAILRDLRGSFKGPF